MVTTDDHRGVDEKLEVVTIPVSDVDRAENFYQRLGWRQDTTPPGSGVIQFTPPGFGCSVQFGTNRTTAPPGSAQGLFLIVSDIEAARDQPAAARSFASLSDPDGNRWQFQEVTTRLPGRVDPSATSFGSASDLASALRRAAAAPDEHCAVALASMCFLIASAAGNSAIGRPHHPLEES